MALLYDIACCPHADVTQDTGVNADPEFNLLGSRRELVSFDLWVSDACIHHEFIIFEFLDEWIVDQVAKLMGGKQKDN